MTNSHSEALFGDPARLLAFIALVVFGLVAFGACTSSTSPPRATISDIMGQPAAWNGRTVQVSGRLLEFRDPDGASYGVIEQGDARIGIRDIKRWRDVIGEDVQVEGTVSFDAGFGFYLANVSVRAMHGTARTLQTP